ncbi:UPF0553 protein [Ceratocystis lukuohia]|uniref:Queuosine 5'-phosphate N-glycosylase/hydrolase n=3 Tax=Ceratocystis TaxID=5157 RepID=A0A0F8B2G8_CERFI|nr:hypothetical protein CFO_g2075 [Ceratocystis platani]PHH53449.1 UPF0553 protein [Ceratocystis fimbriata CBS 114723]
MSDDEADPELLELLRQHVHGKPQTNDEPDTGVLESVEYVYNDSIDVSIDMQSTKRAAESIYSKMMAKKFSTDSWTDNELHPKEKDEKTLAFIVTMDLLNFCFWSEKNEEERFGIEYKGKKWTGYWGLVAALQRALDEDIPITSSDFWQNEAELDLDMMKHIFRSATDEEDPLLSSRLAILREAGMVMYEDFDCSFEKLIASANGSAARLVNILSDRFPCFRDEATWPGRRKPVRFLKRAQILVADVWAAFGGESYGTFTDIDRLTMFADYRVPQILTSLGCLIYSPPLYNKVCGREELESRGKYEMQIRAASVWCVELLRREIKRNHPETNINAVLIDFYLYDTMKQMEAAGVETLPHHRTRSVWY